MVKKAWRSVIHFGSDEEDIFLTQLLFLLCVFSFMVVCVGEVEFFVFIQG